MNNTHAAGMAVASRADVLLMFLAWSLTLAFASMIEDVERERAKETFAGDFGALHARNFIWSDMIVVECNDGAERKRKKKKKVE